MKQTVAFFVLLVSSSAIWALPPEIADPDNGKKPPEGITIGLRDKIAMDIPSGYYWRVMTKLRHAWEAQQPQVNSDDWFIEIRFVLDENGGIRDLSIPDTPLDENAKKAIQAFLSVTPWEKWSEEIKARLKKPVRLDVTFAGDAKSPNHTAEPGSPSRAGSP